MIFSRVSVFLAAACMVLAGCHPHKKGLARLSDPKDSLLYSFVVTGCNRADKKDIYDAGPSTANLPELQQTFDDVANLKPRPDYFFFVGDMIFGYTKWDTTEFVKELEGWKQIYENSDLSHTGIKMVALPGNHELLNAHGGNAGPGYERIWARVMAPYIAGNNGPAKDGPDSLPVDESRMTYSFDYKGSHFVVLNTDGAGKECMADDYWVNQDITKAHDKGAQHIFAFSHIPCYGPENMVSKGEVLDNRDMLWKTFEDNHVEGMFSAHIHVYYRTRPHKGKTWMVIAGNGGSPLNKEATENQKFYGFTLVKVYKSGRVLGYSYGRNVPKAGYFKPVDSPTTIRDSFEISWGPAKH